MGLRQGCSVYGLQPPAPCRAIFQALLNHRLNLRLTEAVSDVENTLAVA
jgi:hypothetical protein